MPIDLGIPSILYKVKRQKYNSPYVKIAIETENIMLKPEYLKIVRYKPINQKTVKPKKPEPNAEIQPGP